MDISLVAAALTSIAGSLHAPISFNGTLYTQDFDTLLNTGTANAWANDTTLVGWHLYHRTSATQILPPVASTAYRADDGTSNAGSFYSDGTTGSADRALGGTASGGAYFGSPPSGTVAGWIALGLTNVAGYTLTDFTISFDGEQWRTGGPTTVAGVTTQSSPQTMVLEYGFGATFASVTTWTAPGGNFDWTSPVFGVPAAAVNGNSAAAGGGLVAGRGGTVGSQTWLNGDTLWIRWIENNDVGNDHNLAIDSFGFNATPTPGAATLLGLGLLASNRRRRA